MNGIAERYAHLVLALGQHDPDYVDAFYGPAEWKTQAEKEKKSLDAIGAEAAELIATLAKIPDAATSGDEMLKLRREYLQKQISALAARVRMLKGEKLKFDDESRALYDAVAPTYRQSGSDPDSHFDQIIAQLEKKIPGKGPGAAFLDRELKNRIEFFLRNHKRLPPHLVALPQRTASPARTLSRNLCLQLGNDLDKMRIRVRAGLAVCRRNSVVKRARLVIEL